MSDRGLSLQSRPSRRRGFRPQHVAAVAAGYWWDPARVSGSGSTILLPEMSGRSAYDQVTPAANTAPSAAFINGQPVLTFTNGSPDQLLRTAAKVTRGWTGATMLWGWVNMAAAAGITVGHWRTAFNVCIQWAAGDVRCNISDLVGGSLDARFPVPSGGYAAGPFYYEMTYDPSLAAANRIGLAYNRVAQTANSSSGSTPATLQDSSEYITIGGTTGDNSTSNYTGTFSMGANGITNGIPSAAERTALYNFRKLV